MIFALVHLECLQCGQQTWATVPLFLLDGPVCCGWCEEVMMLPIVGEAVHMVAGDSHLAYDWYQRDPERVLLESVCH